MSNAEALLDLEGLASGCGLAGIGRQPGRLSSQSTGIQHAPPYAANGEHEHPIATTDRDSSWNCDVCMCSGQGRRRYRCTAGCDWDMCGQCWDQKAAAHEAKFAGDVGTLPVDPSKIPLIGGDGALAAKQRDPWGPGASWTQQNPLSDVLSGAGRRSAATTSPTPQGDVDSFLLERHLWSQDGLSPDALRRTCKQLASAAHAVLKHKFDAADDMGKRLEAASTKLHRLAAPTAAESRGETGWALPVDMPEGKAGSRSGVGDKTGLFYFLGTNRGTAEYHNPAHSSRGKVAVTKGGDGSGSSTECWDYGNGACLLDHQNSNRCRLYNDYGRNSDANHPWVQVELKGDDVIGFLPTHYKIRLADGGEYILRDWEFQGSVDGQAWETLSKHEDDRTFSDVLQCRTFKVSAAKAFFKFFRIEQKQPGVRLDLMNWELYGYLPRHRNLAAALKHAQKSINAASNTSTAVRGTDTIFSEAAITIGCDMLDHLIRNADDAPLASRVLSTLVSSLKALDSRALHGDNRPAAVSEGQLDAIHNFLCQAMPKTADFAASSFHAVVEGLGLLASRRGRLRDVCACISTLQDYIANAAPSSARNIAQSKHDELVRQLLLKGECMHTVQNRDVDHRDALVDPCDITLKVLNMLLIDSCHVGSLWTQDAIRLCWITEQNLLAATCQMADHQLRKCEHIAHQISATAKAIFDVHCSSVDSADLRKSLLQRSTELVVESAADMKGVVESALSIGTGSQQSAMVVANAVLGSIDTINKALSLLGSSEGKEAVENLKHHRACMSFVSRVLSLAQSISGPAKDAPASEGLAGTASKTRPPASMLIGLLAKIQAGIWSHHQSQSNSQTVALMNEYTVTLFKFAAEQIDNVSASELVDRIICGPVGGLLPTWMAILRDEDWQNWQDETLASMQRLFKSMASHYIEPPPEAHLRPEPSVDQLVQSGADICKVTATTRTRILQLFSIAGLDPSKHGQVGSAMLEDSHFSDCGNGHWGNCSPGTWYVKKVCCEIRKRLLLPGTETPELDLASAAGLTLLSASVDCQIAHMDTVESQAMAERLPDAFTNTEGVPVTFCGRVRDEYIFARALFGEVAIAGVASRAKLMAKMKCLCSAYEWKVVDISGTLNHLECDDGMFRQRAASFSERWRECDELVASGSSSSIPQVWDVDITRILPFAALAKSEATEFSEHEWLLAVLEGYKVRQMDILKHVDYILSSKCGKENLYAAATEWYLCIQGLTEHRSLDAAQTASNLALQFGTVNADGCFSTALMGDTDSSEQVTFNSHFDYETGKLTVQSFPLTEDATVTLTATMTHDGLHLVDGHWNCEGQTGSFTGVRLINDQPADVSRRFLSWCETDRVAATISFPGAKGICIAWDPSKRKIPNGTQLKLTCGDHVQVLDKCVDCICLSDTIILSVEFRQWVVGDKIECISEQTSAIPQLCPRLPATIAAVCDDGKSFVVNWDNGDTRHRNRTLAQIFPRSGATSRGQAVSQVAAMFQKIGGVAPCRATNPLSDWVDMFGYICVEQMLNLESERGESDEHVSPGTVALQNLTAKGREINANTLTMMVTDDTPPKMIVNVFDGAGLSPVEPNKVESDARVAVFAALLHHVGLGALIDNTDDSVDLPIIVDEAARHADGIVRRIRSTAEDLRADSDTLLSWLIDAKMRAKFLLKWLPAMEPSPDGAVDRMLARSASSRSLSRGLSRGSSRSSSNGQLSGVLQRSVSNLQSVHALNSSARRTFADITAVLFDNRLSVDAIDKGLNSIEARAHERFRKMRFVASVIETADPLSQNHLQSLAAVTLVDSDYYLPERLASPEGSSEFWKFLESTGLLSGSLRILAPALCCVWRDSDMVALQQHGIHQILCCADDQNNIVIRLLRLLIVLSASLMSSDALLRLMVKRELLTLRDSTDSFAAVALSLPSTKYDGTWLSDDLLRPQLLKHLFGCLTLQDNRTAWQWLPVLNRCLYTIPAAQLDAASISQFPSIADMPFALPGIPLVTVLARLATDNDVDKSTKSEDSAATRVLAKSILLQMSSISSVYLKAVTTVAVATLDQFNSAGIDHNSETLLSLELLGGALIEISIGMFVDIKHGTGCGQVVGTSDRTKFWVENSDKVLIGPLPPADLVARLPVPEVSDLRVVLTAMQHMNIVRSSSSSLSGALQSAMAAKVVAVQIVQNPATAKQIFETKMIQTFIKSADTGVTGSLSECIVQLDRHVASLRGKLDHWKFRVLQQQMASFSRVASCAGVAIYAEDAAAKPELTCQILGNSATLTKSCSLELKLKFMLTSIGDGSLMTQDMLGSVATDKIVFSVQDDGNLIGHSNELEDDVGIIPFNSRRYCVKCMASGIMLEISQSHAEEESSDLPELTITLIQGVTMPPAPLEISARQKAWGVLCASNIATNGPLLHTALAELAGDPWADSSQVPNLEPEPEATMPHVSGSVDSKYGDAPRSLEAAILKESKSMRGDWLTDLAETTKTETSIPVMESPLDDIERHLEKALLCLGDCYCAQVAFKAIALAPTGFTMIDSPSQCESVIKLLRQGYRNEVTQVVDGKLIDAIVNSLFADNVNQSARYLFDSQQEVLLSAVTGAEKKTPVCTQTLETTHNSDKGRGEGGHGWEASLGFENALSMHIIFDDRCQLTGDDKMIMSFPGSRGNNPQISEITRVGTNWDPIDVESNVVKQHVSRHNSSGVFGVKFAATASTDTAYVESKHEYEPNCDYTGSVHFPGATSLQVKFDNQSRTEHGCDHLRFYSDSPAGESSRPSLQTAEFSGDNNFSNHTVQGDTLHWRFTSDSSCQYWGWKFTVSVGEVDCIPQSLSPQVAIARMVYQSIARHKFDMAKELLLSEKSLRMIKSCCYKTTGSTRREMLSMVEDLLCGISTAGSDVSVPRQLADVVTCMYKQSFQESESDRFGNLSVQLLASLVLKLAAAGYTECFQASGKSEPEPEPQGADTPDLPELRRSAIKAGMPFSDAKEASSLELSDFIARQTQTICWKDSAVGNGDNDWVLEGSVATTNSQHNTGNSYRMVAVNLPFPATGANYCKVRVSDFEDISVCIGVCSSFETAQTYNRNEYGWFSAGREGWSLFSDGDGAHNGSWLGGDYGQYAIHSESEVTVLFDADERTLAWAVNGNLKDAVYRNIPEDIELFVHASANGKARFEILECTWGASGTSTISTELPMDPLDHVVLLSVVNETIDALNDSCNLPVPFQVTLTEGSHAQWVDYAREYFVAVHHQRTTGATMPSLPTGFVQMNSLEPGWGQPEDVALLSLLGSSDIQAVKVLEDLSSETLGEMLKDPRYRVLEGREEVILKRARLLERFGPLLVQLLPLMGVEGWYACRDLVPSHVKKKLLQPLLAKAKRPIAERPSVQIDRSLAAGMGPSSNGGSSTRTDGGASNNEQSSILYQVFHQLGDFAERPDIFRGSQQWFMVALVGEHASDAGGVFRETMSNISSDLMSQRTPLFIPTPNQREEVGDLRDMWMPNPGCEDFNMYEFVGRLMAGAIQSEENIVVSLSPFLWRKIAGAPCTVQQFAQGISSSLTNYLKCADMDADTFEFCCNTYEIQQSDGAMVELIPGGAHIDVQYDDRAEWLEMVKQAYLSEVDQQCSAIRRGLLSASIPMPFIALSSQDAFGRAITGEPTITVADMKKQTTFSGVEPADVAMFWACVEDFDIAQRSLLLKFATGRIRLPVALQVQRGDGSADSFPKAATCYQRLYLPRFTNLEAMKAKLLYAVTQCMAIDTDG